MSNGSVVDTNAFYLDTNGTTSPTGDWDLTNDTVTISTLGWYPYGCYPNYYPDNTVQKLRDEIEELEEKLEMLEEKTGFEVVESPRFKVRKKK